MRGNGADQRGKLPHSRAEPTMAGSEKALAHFRAARRVAVTGPGVPVAARLNSSTA